MRSVVSADDIPRRTLLLSLLLMILDSAVSLSTPALAAVVVADLLGEPIFPDLNIASIYLLWILLVCLQAVIRFHSTVLLGTAAATTAAGLRLKAFEHIQLLPVSFFQQREHGDILSLLSEDTRRVSQFLIQTATEFAPHLLTIAGAAYIVVSIDPWTGLGALCIMPAVLLAIRTTGRLANRYSKELSDKHAVHTEMTNEGLRLHMLSKAFTNEADDRLKYKHSNAELLGSEMAFLKASNLISPIVQAITLTTLIGLIWLGKTRLESSSLSTAELTSLIMYGFVLFRPLSALGRAYGAFQSAEGAAARLQTLLQEEREPQETGSTDFPSAPHDIEVENISFAYKERPQLFNGLSVRFSGGKATALTGHNGCGKTTLIHLLLRFFAPTEGTIRINGKDISEIKLSTLRSHIAYVPQNVTLVSGTIKDNIRFGIENSDPEFVDAAAKQAMVTAFASTLPQGLDTPVGPKGARLSGGQKQRIALARALLKNAPILIFDEPTAMFDEQSEVQVIDTLKRICAGKTVIMVTHRAAALALADNSIHLERPLLDTPTKGPV